MAKVFQKDTNGTLLTSLVSYWKLDGDSKDFFSTNNGTDTAITYQSSPALKGQSANFATVNSSKIVLTQPNFGTGQRSYSFWINTTTTTTNQQFMGDRNDNVAWWRIFFDGSSLFDVETQNGVHTFSPGTWADGLWHHMCIVFDATKIHWFKDGVEIGTGVAWASENTNSAINEMQFGASNHSGYTNFYNGNLDEIGMWTKALSATEISDLYNGGAGQTMIIPPSGGTMPLLGV